MAITENNLKIYDRILATLSAIAILVGGFWTLIQFMDAKEKENKLLKQQINFTIFNDKKAIYYELAEAEAEIAACNSYEEVVIAQKHFRKMYLGKAHIIGELDEDVHNQKVAFNRLLEKYLSDKLQERPFDYFKQATLDLVAICKKNLDINSIYK